VFCQQSRSSTYLCVPRVATDRWLTSICCVRPTALETVAGCYTSYFYRHTRLLQTSTEGVPVSLSGHHVADHSTSEELFNRGYSKVCNININITTTTVTTTRCWDIEYVCVVCGCVVWYSFRYLQMTSDSRLSELNNEVKLKSFEGERTQLVHEETCRILKQTQLDNEKLNSKLEVLHFHLHTNDNVL